MGLPAHQGNTTAAASGRRPGGARPQPRADHENHRNDEEREGDSHRAAEGDGSPVEAARCRGGGGDGLRGMRRCGHGYRVPTEVRDPGAVGVLLGAEVGRKGDVLRCHEVLLSAKFVTRQTMNACA